MDIHAIFPLQIVSFPGETINLHIFETRYKQLVNECLEDSSKLFALVPVISEKIQDLGTLLHVSQLVKKYEDGRMDIKCKAVRRVRIKEILSAPKDRLYMKAETVRLHSTDTGDQMLYTDLKLLILEFQELVKADKPIISNDGFNAFGVASKLALSMNQKMELLRLDSERDRQHFLIDHLRNLIPVISQVEEAKKRITMNGHFPHFPKLDL